VQNSGISFDYVPPVLPEKSAEGFIGHDDVLRRVCDHNAVIGNLQQRLKELNRLLCLDCVQERLLAWRVIC